MYQGMLIGSFKYCSIFIFLEQSYFHYHTYIIISMFWVTKLYNFAVNIHVGYSCRLSSFLCELHACVRWKKRHVHTCSRSNIMQYLPSNSVSMRNLIYKVVFY